MPPIPPTTGASVSGPNGNDALGGIVTLTAGPAEVRVARFGAHVLSWRDGLGVDRLWMSRLSAMDASSPIRGGIPLAWPQFADQGTLPLHGFVRVQFWKLESVNVYTEAGVHREQEGPSEETVPVAEATFVLTDEVQAGRRSHWGSCHTCLHAHISLHRRQTRCWLRL